jgi:hypothetical protein
MLFSKVTLLALALVTSALAAELRGAEDQRELNHQHLLADCTNCDNGSSGQCLQAGAGRVCWLAVENACPYYAPTACDGTPSGPTLSGCDLCSGSAVCAYNDGSRCVDLQVPNGDLQRSQCTPGTTLCPTCINTGTDTDYGCSSAKPVCASDWANEPNVGDEGTKCRTCINDKKSNFIDTGCSSSTPKCMSNSCSA